MGQSQSTTITPHHNTTTTPPMTDYTSNLPDECLSLIFNHLASNDRKQCSLVSHRWLVIEGQSRNRLSLNAVSDLHNFIPNIFTRFDNVTKLSLRCDRRSVSVNDDNIVLISSFVPNLVRLKLRGCREITSLGLEHLGKSCKNLKKFSCGSCLFGVRGIHKLLENCSKLEELSIKRLRDNVGEGGGGGNVNEPIGIGAASGTLRVICLKELYNGQMFGEVISGAKNLRSLKLLRCLGDWDKLLEGVSGKLSLVEVHLERLQVSDVGLSALSSCGNLEVLHIVKTPECTNLGVVEVAEKCRFLRKVHIDGWRTNRIGNEGLVAIAKYSVNLQELVLIGVNPSLVSLEAIATNCQKLERLALCGSETIADGEIACIASKCVALKKLCIKGCPVSDEGIEAFAWGCPNLVKIKVKKCKNVTCEVGDWLRARRGSLVVNLDVCEVEMEVVDASASDGVQEDVAEFPPVVSDVAGSQPDPPSIGSSSSRSGRRASIFKTRFGLFGGRGLVPCTFRRWANGNRCSNSNGSSS